MNKLHKRRPQEDGISRRDFLQGTLLAAGGAAVAQFFPLEAMAKAPPNTGACDGLIGTDPRVLHGGNLRDTFAIAHWLRDGRLTWRRSSVRISPSRCDDFQGNFPILDDTGNYDLIIVGGGISGLATAYFAQQMRPYLRILILENNLRLGGNASRDDGNALPVLGSAAGAYFAYPYADFLFDFYGGIGIDWDSRIIPSPIYSYFFDADVGPQTTRSLMPRGTATWVADPYTKKGIDRLPFEKEIRQQFHSARQDLINWYVRSGAPTDPPDDSDPKYDHLAHQSFREYLEIDRGFDPVVADFYDQYSSDALGGLTADVNAHSAISFLGAEFFSIVSAPGGLSYVARKALKALIPNAIAGDTEDDIINNPINFTELDKSTNQVRYRTAVTALRCETNAGTAEVSYFNGTDSNFYQAQGKAIVLAGQMHTSQHLVRHLVDDRQSRAASAYQHVPVTIANVAVKNSHFLVDAGVGYDFYWYGDGDGDSERIWQDAVVADWTEVGGTIHAEDGSRPNVLTVYSGGFKPFSDASEERLALLNEPFSTYEGALREDLNRIFGAHGFDFDHDVSAIHLYRWGHPLVAPYVGWLFGEPMGGSPGRIQRTDNDRHRAREPVGRISFAAQDSEGNPAIESAIFAGLRAAHEVSAYL